jgi:Zn-dependent peptidase ImmA (M78 family)
MDSHLASRCIEYVRELRSQFCNSTAAPPLKALVEHLGVAEVRERPLDRDARLVKQSGQLIIEVNSLYSQARRRLSIAHELGHLIVDRCSATPNEHWGKTDPSIESLCDRLAYAILSPD